MAFQGSEGTFYMHLIKTVKRSTSGELLTFGTEIYGTSVVNPLTLAAYSDCSQPDSDLSKRVWRTGGRSILD